MSTLKTNNIQHVDRSDPSIIINTDGSVNIAGTMTYEDVTNVDSVGIITGRELINAQKQVHVGTGVSVKAGGINVTAGITTVQALQATTGTFSAAVSGTTGTFSGDITANGNIVGDNSTDISGINDITASMLSISDTITHTGDTNTKIRFPSADTFTVETGGSERVRITSIGLVGIGTDNPTSHANTNALQIHDDYNGEGSPRIRLTNITTGTGAADGFELSVDGSNQHGIIRQRENADILFYTNSLERVRINSNGRVGINATSPASRLDVRDTSTTSYPFTSADSGVYSYSPYSHELNVRNNTTGTTDGFAGIHFHAGERSAGGRQGTARISALYTGEYKADLVFATRNVSFKERVRITSAGKVGIGTDSPQEELTIMSATPALMLRDTDQGGSYTQVSNSNQDMYFSANGATAHANFLFRSGSGGSFTERMRITSTGDVSIADGNLIVAGGHGIDFSATGDASGSSNELLHDYEEGTWTPSIDADSGSVTTYYNQEGAYTKIGRLVKCHFRIRINDAGDTSGSIRIAGLPFTVGNTLSSTGLDGSGGPTYWTAQGVSIVNMTITPVGADTKAYVYIATASTIQMTNLTRANAFGGGWDIRAEMMYFT